MVQKAPNISKHCTGRARISTLRLFGRRPPPSSLVEGIDCNAASGKRWKEVVVGVAVVGEAVHESKASFDIGSWWGLKSELETSIESFIRRTYGPGLGVELSAGIW